MLRKAYCIVDTKSSIKYDPIFCENDDQAIRIFQAQIRTGSMIYDWPEDFQLWFAGAFDTDSGYCLEPGTYDIDKPYCVALALDLKEKVNEIQKND